MEGIVRPSSITAEELLLRLKKATAQLTLLKKQNSELIQKQSANECYISELEQRLVKREMSDNQKRDLLAQIDKLKAKVERQSNHLRQLQNQ